jgi:hypothetical protein
MEYYLRTQNLEFAKFNRFINLFTPYLKNLNISNPIQKDIIDDGDCFFHSLEYAKGNVGLYKNYNSHVRRTRFNIINDLIKKVGRNYMVAGKPLYTYKTSTQWAEDIITKEAAIYAEKCLFILSYNPPDETKKIKSDENQGRITLIQPIGLELNATNIIFIVNKHNAHFVTFKSNDVGQNEILKKPVTGTEFFIKGLNEFLLYTPNANIGEIEYEMKKYQKVNVFSFLLKDFIAFLNRERVNNFSNRQNSTSPLNELQPYITKEAIQLQKEYNAKKESNAKKQSNAKQSNAKQSNAKKKKPVVSIKQRRLNEREQRKTKKNSPKQPFKQHIQNNTNSNSAIAEILRKEELELANARFARELGKF